MIKKTICRCCGTAILQPLKADPKAPQLCPECDPDLHQERESGENDQLTPRNLIHLDQKR